MATGPMPVDAAFDVFAPALNHLIRLAPSVDNHVVESILDPVQPRLPSVFTVMAPTRDGSTSPADLPADALDREARRWPGVLLHREGR